MPDVCRAYDAYEAYEVWKRFFREDGGRERLSTHGVRTPSTACELLPPSADGPPPSKREVLGLRRSRPSAFPSIAYRGFAVAPITLRASSRSLLYNPGCRVATLLVSKGVMGFLGERVLRPWAVEGVLGGRHPTAITQQDFAKFTFHEVLLFFLFFSRFQPLSAPVTSPAAWSGRTRWCPWGR